ncbi:acyltransferase/acetyltransferase [Spirochaetia bacterium]|nr:acyltransferase/acetyltransferase [Spirochaetia bacterium]
MYNESNQQPATSNQQPATSNQQPATSNQRIEYIDLLKVFTIFCVLWGHAIQQLDNGLDWIHCTENPIFKLLYSFHMPLFYMLSGFFFKSSLKNNLKDFVFKKGIQLLLPWFIWCVLRGSLLLINTIIIKGNDVDLIQAFRIIFGGHFWFLRELFISYFITYVGYKILKKGYLVAILAICFTLFAPLMSSQSFYLPIFFVGIMLKEYYQFIRKHINIFLCVSAVIFILCLLFWKGIYYGLSPRIFSFRTFSFNFSNTPVALYRLLTGISGSIFLFSVFARTYKGNKDYSKLSSYGKYTLEIYILQVILIETMLTKMIDFPNINIWVYSLVITPIIALMVFILCVVIIKFIQKCKYIDFILFGHKINSINKL